jgi:dihydroorotase
VVWRLDPSTLRSQGRHTPFNFADTGMMLPGRVRATLVAGSVAFERAAVASDA